jgi:sialic acid synthase SpsE
MKEHMPEISIGNKVIGNDQPCYLIAEIGSNHNHDFELAKELIDAAAEAGVDAVKFQTFRAKSHYSKFTPNFNYLKGQDTFSLIKSLELNREWQEPLKHYAEEKNVDFLSSPCDSEAIDLLEELGVKAYKVASFDITDDRLIRKMAMTGKPIILSTGMASLADIQFAVNTCLSVGNKKIILLQCTSLYPAPVVLSNLKAMQSISHAFGTLVGYSDHTMGDHISIAAVALGATVIEKHFTLDRTLPGPDHPFAIEPDELTKMVSSIRDVESSLGDGLKNGPRAEENDMLSKGRRSIHAGKIIRKGDIIDDDMLVIKRPGYGITPINREHLIGRVARVEIEEDQWITWNMI